MLEIQVELLHLTVPQNIHSTVKCGTAQKFSLWIHQVFAKSFSKLCKALQTAWGAGLPATAFDNRPCSSKPRPGGGSVPNLRR